MKKTILSVLAVSALVFACKKDKDDSNGLNKEALVGKWEMKVQYRNVVDNNTSKRDTLAIPAGFQGWQFFSDGTVIVYLRTIAGMARDTGTYRVSGPNVIISEPGVTKSDTTKITKITSTELQAYKKRVVSATRYAEYWFDYKKQ